MKAGDKEKLFSSIRTYAMSVLENLATRFPDQDFLVNFDVFSTTKIKAANSLRGYGDDKLTALANFYGRAREGVDHKGNVVRLPALVDAEAVKSQWHNTIKYKLHDLAMEGYEFKCAAKALLQDVSLTDTCKDVMLLIQIKMVLPWNEGSLDKRSSRQSSGTAYWPGL